MTKVSPSMLSSDLSRLGEELMYVDKSGADWAHIDVMDGSFVPNITFGPPVIKAIRKYSDIPLDVHLMIQDPIRYIDMFANVGCDIITIHCESIGDILGAMDKIKSYGIKVGIQLNPETPIENLYRFLKKSDMVLIMTVEPGFDGQTFMDSCLSKLVYISRWVESNGYEIEISVDGGINSDTGKKCVSAGATVLVSGSFLFGLKDMSSTISKWKKYGRTI